MTDDSPYWAIACTATNRADVVATLLQREGFETYLPKIRLPQRRAAPLFPGYLIVRVFVRWYPIRWTPGVLRVLMNGDRPAHLADAIVNEIKSREVRGFVKLPKDPNALEPGRKVRVLHGMFAGRIGIYEGMSGPEREKVLLDWLGRSVSVNMPRGSLEVLPTVA